MLILNAQQVELAFPMDLAIESMAKALIAISGRRVDIPLRTHLNSPEWNGTTLVMPARVNDVESPSLAVKIVSVFQDNPDRGLPRIQGAVLVVDPETGQPQALIDGASLTAIRTAAASAAATQGLAREDAKVLAVIGTGIQAMTHIAAISTIRSIDKILIASREISKAQEFAEKVSVEFEIDAEAGLANDAIAQADIVCTLTNAKQPVFDAHAINAGTHINAVGSHDPAIAEVPGQVVATSRVFVDHHDAAWKEAGDILVPLTEGLIRKEHVLGEVGQVLSGQIEGRKHNQDITLFKSLGNAAEDCFAAQAIFSNAMKAGLGQVVAWP